MSIGRTLKTVSPLVAVVAAVGVFVSCKNDAPPAEAEPAPAPTQEAAPAPAAVATATIAGVVRFTGAAPAEAKIDMRADKKCAKLGAGAMTRKFGVTDGHLRDAFVWIKSGLARGVKYAVPKTMVSIDQKGCRYEPYVVGVRVGQKFEFVNSDPVLHNIHVLSKNEFNRAMPTQGQRLTRKFKKRELRVRVKCDVHPWMAAWINVMNHPFFAVTGDDGRFELAGLPAGKYTVAVWHPSAGEKSAEVEVGAGAQATTTFELSAP